MEELQSNNILLFCRNVLLSARTGCIETKRLYQLIFRFHCNASTVYRRSFAPKQWKLLKVLRKKVYKLHSFMKKNEQKLMTTSKQFGTTFTSQVSQLRNEATTRRNIVCSPTTMMVELWTFFQIFLFAGI